MREAFDKPYSPLTDSPKEDFCFSHILSFADRWINLRGIEYGSRREIKLSQKNHKLANQTKSLMAFNDNLSDNEEEEDNEELNDNQYKNVFKNLVISYQELEKKTKKYKKIIEHQTENLSIALEKLNLYKKGHDDLLEKNQELSRENGDLFDKIDEINVKLRKATFENNRLLEEVTNLKRPSISKVEKVNENGTFNRN